MANPTFKPLKFDPFNNGKLLEGLFLYQGNLLTEYINRKKLPEKTLEWQSKDYQTFLKKTISNLMEEMAETALEQDKILDIMKNTIFNDDENKKKMVEYAKAAGIEFADALHFFIELMIYSDIGPLEVREYYKELGNQGNLSGLAADDGLNSAFAFARHLNIYEDDVRENTYYAFTNDSISSTSLDTPFRKVHPHLLTTIDKLYWKVAKTLLKAQNTLKLREWRSTHETVLSVQSYQNMLMEAFTYFIQIADAMTITPEMAYNLYETKNEIVQKRIADGY